MSDTPVTPLQLLCWDCKKQITKAGSEQVRTNPHSPFSRSMTRVCVDCALGRLVEVIPDES